MAASAADGSVLINTKLDTSGLDKGLNGISAKVDKVKRSFDGVGSSIMKIGGLVAGAFAVKSIINFGKECLELGSNLAEVQNVVDVTFTTMSKKVDEFAKTAMSAYGLSETMSKQFVGTFGSMAKAFGFTEQEALDMSTTLTGLAGDVASFYNIDQEAAYTKLKSVFSGETESLKDLGIVMTQSALDSYAMANGLGKTTAQMTEQEKVALRYRFILDQLSAASGDFQRTSGGWANQVRILKLQFDSLKATVGQGLINLFTPVIKVINVMLAKLATLANAFKSLTELITGNKSSGTTSAAQAGLGGDGMAEIADQASQAADSTAGAAAATNDLADAQNNNADATRNARREQDKFIAGFDQITKISANNNDSPAVPSGSAGAAPGAGAGSSPAAAISPVNYGEIARGESELEKTEGLLDKLIKKAKQLAKIFQKGFFAGLGDFEPKLANIKENIDSIGKSLQDIFTDSRVISAADNCAKQIAYSLGQVAGSMASIGLTIAQLLTGGIAKFLDQSKDRIKTHLIAMFDITADIAEIIGNYAQAVAEVFSVFGDENAQGVLGNLLSIVYEAGALIQELAGLFVRDILDILTKPFIENKDSIITAINGTLGAIRTFLDGILSVVQRVSDGIRKLYDEHLHPLFESIGNGLSSIYGILLKGYNEWVLPVIQGLAEKFKALMDGPFGTALDNILSVIGDIIDAVKFLWENAVQPFLEFIGAVAMGVLSAVINTVGTFLLNALAGVSEFINTFFMPAWQAIKDFLAIYVAPVIETIGGALTYLKDQVMLHMTEFLNGDFSAAWNAIKDLWNTYVVPVIDSVKEGLKKLWEKTLVPLGEFLSGTFQGAWDALQKFWNDTVLTKLTDLYNAFLDFKDSVLSPLATFVSNTLYLAWQKIITFFSGTASQKLHMLYEAFQKFKDAVLSPLAKVVRNTLLSAWEKITDYFGGAVSEKLSAIHTAFKNFKDLVISPLAKIVRNTLYDAWEKITNFFGGDAYEKASGIAGILKYLLDNVVTPLATFVSGTMATAFSGLTTVFGDLLTYIQNTFATGWDTAWNGIVEAFGRIFGGISEAVKGPINAVIGFINSLIDKINSVLQAMADFITIGPIDIPLPFGNEIHMDQWRLWDNPPWIGKIPELAKGAVIPPNAPFTAVLGDQRHGTNIEAPLDTIKQALAEVLGRSDTGSIQEISGKLDTIIDNSITQADIIDIVRRYLSWSIGDEQLARHANAGNAMLDRRLHPVKGGA